jgi:hypothetical protein
MRLDICGQFVVNVVRPDGGWSKGRPIAFIEELGALRQADLFIPNDLSDRDLERCGRQILGLRQGRQAIWRLDARSPSARASAQMSWGCL